MTILALLCYKLIQLSIVTYNSHYLLIVYYTGSNTTKYNFIMFIDIFLFVKMLAILSIFYGN